MKTRGLDQNAVSVLSRWCQSGVPMIRLRRRSYPLMVPLLLVPLSSVQTNITTSDAPHNKGYRSEMETNPTISYTVQFRSAQPIREAQVRSSQLNSHYDAMSADKKAAFDASAGKFLAATFPDRVLVAVTFHTNVQDYVSELRSYWTDQSPAKLNK